MTNGSGTGFLALCLGALVISFAPILTRISEVEPSATAFWRLALAAPLLIAWRSVERRRHPSPIDRRDIHWLVLAGASFAADLAFWHWSIRWTSIAAAALLANLAPVFVTLGAWLLFGARPTATFVGALALSFSGVAVLMSHDLGAAVASTALVGDLFGLLAAVFYAGYLLAVHRVRARVSTATVMAWTAVVSACLMLIVSLASGESIRIETGRGFAILAALGILVHAGGQSLIGYALAHVPAALGSMGLLLQPVGAAVLASALLGEDLGLRQILGGTLVLLGILLARLR